MRLRIGIQTKAIVAISVLMTALGLLLMGMSLYNGSRAVRAELMRRGEISAANLAYNAAYPTLIGDTVSVVALLEGILAEKEVIYAQIVDPAGAAIVRRQNKGPVVGSVAANGKETVHSNAPITIREERQGDPGSDLGIFDVSGATGATDEASHLIGYAQIGMTTRYIEESIGRMRANMIGVSLVIVIIALLITSLAVRWSISPINQLVAATGRVAGGDYDTKVSVARRDEIGDLANSFNKMTADLKAQRDALVEKDLLEALVRELKETQQQLVQAGKMAALGQLAAGIAHEINNPLAGIMGYAQLAGEHVRAKLHSGIPPAELPKFIGYIDNMEKQTLRCKQIVQNLLRFARRSSPDEEGTVDCNEVVRETLNFLTHEINARTVVVETDLAERLPPLVGNAGKLQQVFTNILLNALQAIRCTGHISIRTARGQDHVRVEIQDTGEGIPAEHLDKVFEPFFTTKEIGQGTGLGLSVTYGLVKDMGGNIAVESEVGVGTTFTLSFPLPGCAPATDSGVAPGAHGQPTTVDATRPGR